MKGIIKLSALVILFACLATISQAQDKYGHTNSGIILEALPEVKNADKELAEYRKQLLAKRDQMMKTFQDKYTAVAEKANAGEYSQIELQEKDAELKRDREEIGQYEQDVQQKIVKKREELLAPILGRVDEVIQKLGEEKGYTMIFDVSVGGLLFVQESEDVTDQILTRLGVEAPN